MEQFLTTLREAGLLDEQGRIVLKRYLGGGYQCVEAEVFASIFGSALNDAEGGRIYEALLAADADPATGNPRGYARFFQEWHQVGLI
ncbi:MAG: hypothetical protein ACPL7O_02735 [Armatimonadota bacterium]